MFLIADTESNGLFDFKRPADAEGQPRTAEVAFLYVNDALEVESEFQAYVQPDGWEMTPEATAINGLTTEFLREHGKPIAEILMVYSAAIAEGRALVAHNAQHEAKALRSELRRAGLPDLFDDTKNVCTMRKANGHILKASGKKGWPSLAEVRAFLKLPTDRPHGALSDARDALAAFRYLKAQGVDMTPEVHRAAENHPALQGRVQTPEPPPSQFDGQQRGPGILDE